MYRRSTQLPNEMPDIITSLLLSLQVIGAVGNSLTAGLFIRGFPVEYKGLAFTGGV